MSGVYLKYNNNTTYYDSFITMYRFLKTKNISYMDCIIYPSTKNNQIDTTNPIKLYPVPIINRYRTSYNNNMELTDINDEDYPNYDNYEDYDNYDNYEDYEDYINVDDYSNVDNQLMYNEIEY